MNVAILTATFSYFSGIDRVIENQAKEFIKKGDRVTILALASEISTKGFDVVVLGMPRRLLWQRLYRLLFFLDYYKINKYTQKLKDFDIIYSHQYPMNLLAWRAKKKYGKKYIYYNHGIAPASAFKNLMEKLYITLFKYFANLTIKKADYTISVSKYLANILKKETGMNSEVVYNKIDSSRFRSGINSYQIRKKYNLGNNKVILYVGRLSPHKGIHLLIQIFNEVLKKIPNTKLLIVGKKTFSKYGKFLNKIANNNVIFTGSVSDNELPEYYAACDIYATASLWEGFDLPIIEAQTCGKSVVAFDLCSHPEIIDKNGILVEPRNINAFVNALNKLLRK